MRIALISDIHYGAMSTTSELAIQGEPPGYGEVLNAKPFFQGLIDALTKERPRYLFIAGDLTSTGNPLEFKYCYEKIFQLAKTIDIPPENVIISAGNHDIDWRITRAIEQYKSDANATYSNNDIDFLEMNYQKLALTWATTELPCKPELFTYRYGGAPLSGVIERDDCVIFVLNSGHLCSHDKTKKHGCLSNQQLQWFKELAQKYKSSAKTKIVLLHHHPFSYPFLLPGRDISTLEEGSELCQICGESGIDLVLHGHRHHPKAKTVSENGWDNPVTYICAGSLSVNATHRLDGLIPNTFHIVEYDSRERIILKNYEYSHTDGWTPTKTNRPEVPLEGNMLLGKPININDPAITELIMRLPINRQIMFDSLDNDLSYITRQKLTELVEQALRGCSVYQKSDHFVIFRRPDGDNA